MPDARTSTRPAPLSSAFSRSASASGRFRHLAPDDADVLPRLREARHHGDRVGEGRPPDRVAEEEGGREAVAGDVVAQADDVARLLAAEDRAFARSASST